MAVDVTERAIRLPEAMDMVGMSRSWVYARIAKGEFPKPAYQFGGAKAWSLTEVLAWIDKQRIKHVV